MDTKRFPSFSVYPRGHKVGSKAVPENRPCKEVTLLDVYEYITHAPQCYINPKYLEGHE